jgi:alkanesulfonate monooxygenase SsuD/methylene tetrahydromethanopterin reductase-like flavin-dependent oxidoreductase (luciferase family)
MTGFRGELALKFALQSATQYGTPDVVRLARLALGQGFKQIWVNDNLGQRNIFVVLAAIAAQVPIKLGTAIVVPYFRNPVDIADSLAALSELTEGREVSVGIARGESARAGQQVEMPNPVAMVRETTLAIKALLAGDSVKFRDYPTACAYHHIHPEQEFRLDFSPGAPMRFYCGGHGKRILKVAGEVMDGIYFGDHAIPVMRAGRLDAFLAVARAASATRSQGRFDICELDISLSRDRASAFAYARPFAAHVLVHLEGMGFTADDFQSLAIEPRLVDSLIEACRGGATIQAASALLSDDVVKSCFVVGSPEECRDQLAALMDEAERLKFSQMAFAKLGPDYHEAISLLRDICGRS